MNKKLLRPAVGILLLGLVFLSARAYGKDQWLQVRSKNFFLIGNASEKDIKKAATKLEQFRESFRLLFTKTSLNSAIPTNVIVFKSDSAYKPYKPRRADGKADTFIAGYFQPGQDVNYITLSADGEDNEMYGTVFHEYVHFIIDTNYGKSEVPPWFNEGLAEYYQTFQIQDDQVIKLGLPQSNHLYLLSQSKFIPLQTLFSISNAALHQNGDHSRSIFYAESWALIHYLLQSGKSDGLGKFLQALLKDVPQEKAFQDAFQTTYAAMEKDLRKYVSQNSYQYQQISLKNKISFDADMQVAPLTEPESNAYLGDLLYHTNRADDAEALLRNALTADPDSGLANIAMGMVKMRQRKSGEAKSFLEKAISKDPKNHLAYYHYAYLLSREDQDEFGFSASIKPEAAEKIRNALQKAIAINPTFTESYELLAFVNLVNNEKLDESVELMKTALRYQPGSQRYALRIAELYLRQEKLDEAEALAAKITATADEPEVKSRAEQITAQIAQHRTFVQQREEFRKKYESGRRIAPVLMKRSEKPPTPEEIARYQEEANIRSINEALRPPEAGESRVLGTVQKIDCKVRPIIFTVKTDTEAFGLTTKDFASLNLNAFVSDARMVQVGCDADFSSIRLVVTYRDQPAKTTRGELLSIEFVPKNFRILTDEERKAPAPYLPDTDAVVVVSENRTGSAPEPDGESRRRDAMTQALRNALRSPQDGEKRIIGFLDKTECSTKGITFSFRAGDQLLKLFTTSPQALQIRSMTPDMAGAQFGCNMKPIEFPAVVVYKVSNDPKAKVAGEILTLDFVPKTFTLE